MEWLGFLGSIIGGLIGGLFTFFGVKLTIKHEDQEKEKEAQQKILDTRPRLEIISHSEIKPYEASKQEEWTCSVLTILGYDGRFLNMTKLHLTIKT